MKSFLTKHKCVKKNLKGNVFQKKVLKVLRKQLIWLHKTNIIYQKIHL